MSFKRLWPADAGAEADSSASGPPGIKSPPSYQDGTRYAGLAGDNTLLAVDAGGASAQPVALWATPPDMERLYHRVAIGTDKRLHAVWSSRGGDARKTMIYVKSVNPDGTDHRLSEFGQYLQSSYFPFNQEIVLGPDNRWYTVLTADRAKQINTPALGAMSAGGQTGVITELPDDMYSVDALAFGPEGGLFGIGRQPSLRPAGVFMIDPLHTGFAPPVPVFKTIGAPVKQMETVEVAAE